MNNKLEYNAFQISSHCQYVNKYEVIWSLSGAKQVAVVKVNNSRPPNTILISIFKYKNSLAANSIELYDETQGFHYITFEYSFQTMDLKML